MTNWKFEYRAFVDFDPTDVRQKVEDAMKDDGLTKRVQDETDTYCVGGATDIALRVRDTQVKMKGPINAVDDLVDEMYDERAYLPVDRCLIADTLGLRKDKKSKQLKTLDEVKAYMKKKGSKTSVVEKDMTKYESHDIEVEISSVKIDGTQKWTICVAGSDAAKVREAVEKYHIKGVGQKMHYAEAVKQIGL